MPPVLAKDTEIHVSTTAEGTYALIGKVLTIAVREEEGDDEEIYVFGEDAAMVEEGTDEATIDLTLLYDPTDTTGQDVLRTAKTAGQSVFIRMLWDGANGKQQECRVRTINMDADRNGTGVNKYVRGSISLRSIAPATAVTAA